ncbi:MAG: putative DNA binding domain-containing protein [Ignavibacteriales bacterium]|nr:putative DNA binding domain-containing protein [Ignavibacteriales bacterium]
MIEFIKNLLKQKEGIRLEFKEAKEKLPENLFETICAFLNREGGSIMLGVTDDGTCIGVAPELVGKFSAEISSLSNNKNKLDPPFILFPSIAEIKRTKIIHIQVPASSQVHKCNGVIFDRSADGDFRVTDTAKIAELHNRKKAHFTEGIIYPALAKKDFVKELFPKIRNLIRSNKPNHPWLALDDQQLFVTSGLYKKDYQTNKEGFTLAAALLLGKEETIQNILPHYKIDALVRKQNLERYDDRLIIRTNLIDAYDLLMGFIEKHLPDKFYMEGATRISIREKIFREVVANLIVHREYTNAHSASLIIYTDRIEVLNANNPNGSGPISINNFTPFPKNPTISKFFVQLGRVEELGSGLINVERYLKLYSKNSTPVFIEDYVFKTIIPTEVEGTIHVAIGEADTIGVALDAVLAGGVSGGVSGGISGGVSNDVKNRLMEILGFLLQNNGAKLAEIEKKIKLTHRTAERYIRVLRSLKVIKFVGAAKTGRYIVTKIFMDKVNQKEA